MSASKVAKAIKVNLVRPAHKVIRATLEIKARKEL